MDDLSGKKERPSQPGALGLRRFPGGATVVLGVVSRFPLRGIRVTLGCLGLARRVFIQI